MTPLETVLDYHRAWTGGDVDRAMTRVADDVTYRTPDGVLTGKDAYRAFLAGFAPSLTGVTDVAQFAEGDRVALFYHPQTAATATALAAEHFTVRGDTIVETLLVFDRLSYLPAGER